MIMPRIFAVLLGIASLGTPPGPGFAQPASPDPAGEHAEFTLPPAWTYAHTHRRGLTRYMTKKNPKATLAVIIRHRTNTQSTPRDMTAAQAKDLKAHGFQITRDPEERTLGASTWSWLRWENVQSFKDSPTPFRGENYYTQGRQVIVEVMVTGPTTRFESFDRQEFERFLASVQFKES